MGTNIRPEISKKSKYWISKHRYYELKHFCLQYDEWKDLYLKLDGLPVSKNFNRLPRRTDISNPTERVAIAKAEYAANMHLIEQAARETDPELSNYIFKAVTKGISYTTLITKYGIPCCKETYYDRYRRFFWILSRCKE